MPGKVDADRGVELADVDPELERVGGDDREQLAAGELRLDLAPLLGRVAGPVGGDPSGEAGSPSSSSRMRVKRWISSMPRRLRRKQIVRAPLTTRSASSSAVSERTERRVIESGSITGGFQIAIRRAARGRAVGVDERERAPGERARELQRVGDRRRGADEARLGPVDAGDPLQPPQHVGDVRAEHPAVGVGLVDDHEA